MSKIFEALNRAKQEDPELQLPETLEHVSRPPGGLPPSPEPETVPPPRPVTFERYAAASAPAPAPAGPYPVLPVRIASSAPVLPFDGSEPYVADQYRIIRTKLVQHPRQPKVCVVSSAGPRDGKTITAINLAAALALRGEAKVALIDADLRRPSIGELLSIPSAPGLAAVLAGECDMENALINIQQLPTLYVMPGGHPRANPSELLDSERLENLCNRLREEFRFVIIDAPPMIGIADFALIQAKADGVIAVVRPDHTNRAMCAKAFEAVPPEKLIGVTMNCVPEWFLNKKHSSAHYYYASVGQERGQGLT